MKEVAIHIDPESRVIAREGKGEALTGECVGQAIESPPFPSTHEADATTFSPTHKPAHPSHAWIQARR